MVTRALFAIALLIAPAALAQTFTAAGLSLPSSVLQDAQVRKQLGSGLTSTFIVTAKRGEAIGAARLEVRYDLWDEIYIVRRIDSGGRRDAARVAAGDALDRWWRAPLRVLDVAGGERIDVEVRVLPFSAAEEADAREWLSKSGGVRGNAGGGGLVNVLIGTTLNARPITTFRWTLEVPRR